MKKKHLLLPLILLGLLCGGCSFLKLPFDNSSNTMSSSENSSATSGNVSSSSSNASSSKDSSSTISVKGVTVSPKTLELNIGGTSTLTATVSPYRAANKKVSWSSNKPTIASVNSAGLVTANNAGTATITVTTEDGHFTDTCEVTVKEPSSKDKYTILIYMCGSDLESDYADYEEGGYRYTGLATSDLLEIQSIGSYMPDGVNVVVETGGSSKWDSTFKISNKNLERYHFEKTNLVKDASLANASMGSSATLQSFLEWGLSEYPAEQTGLILWNHGGAINGVCSDEIYKDTLVTSEVAYAVKNALATVGIKDKLTWIGYDACLMSVADIASINADYFNYMVASQESESGYGWDYDVWVKNIYTNPSIAPTSLLPTIASSFVKDNDKWGKTSNDQTLSVLDLSKMSTFISAFNTYASNLAITTTTKFSSLKTAFNSSLKFGYDSELSAYLFGVADFSDFLTKMQSKFSSVSTTELVNALSNLVIANSYGGYYSSKAVKPCGLCVFVAYAERVDAGGGYYYGLQASKTNYSTSDTKFTEWRTIQIKYWDQQ